MNFEDKVLALFDNGRRSAVYVAGYQSARAQAAAIAAEADRLIAEMAVENAELREALATKDTELREALREAEHFLTQIDPVHWPSKREARRIIGIVRVALASPAATEPADEPSHAETICDSECTWSEHYPRCIAAKWREQNGYVGKGGVVTVFNDQVCGWVNELRNPENWTPGAIAVDESGNQWEARGGDEQRGALRWEPVAQQLDIEDQLKETGHD